MTARIKTIVSVISINPFEIGMTMSMRILIRLVSYEDILIISITSLTPSIINMTMVRVMKNIKFYFAFLLKSAIELALNIKNTDLISYVR